MHNKVILKFPIGVQPSIDKSCCLTISLGQKNQEGLKLEATIRAINKNFRECAVMLCDSLQRYNLCNYYNQNLTALHIKANEIGQDWLEKNSVCFKWFTIPFEVYQWDYWICMPNYVQKLFLIEKLYDLSEEYRFTFIETANLFWQRLNKRNDYLLDYAQFVHNSILYLKEECAVMLLQAEYNYNFEVYNGQRNSCMAATYEHFIKPINPNVLKSVSLKFKKNKISQPLLV